MFRESAVEVAEGTVMRFRTGQKVVGTFPRTPSSLLTSNEAGSELALSLMRRLPGGINFPPDWVARFGKRTTAPIPTTPHVDLLSTRHDLPFSTRHALRCFLLPLRLSIPPSDHAGGC